MRLPRGIRRKMVLRSFLAQGSWNYETLLGTGFAFMLLPALRHIYREDPDALRSAIARHSGLFNSHPYLITIAAGAVARLESEGEPPELVERFKTAIRGSLGSIGDQLIWLSWRPAVALLAVGMLLLGLPWWIAVLAFLVVYNSLHLWLRSWGMRIGLEEGLGVGRVLRDAPLRRWGKRAADAGAVLSGLCVALAVSRAGEGAVELAIASTAAAAALVLGLRLRYAVFLVLLLVWIAGVVVGVTS